MHTHHWHRQCTAPPLPPTHPRLHMFLLQHRKGRFVLTRQLLPRCRDHQGRHLGDTLRCRLPAYGKQETQNLPSIAPTPCCASAGSPAAGLVSATAAAEPGQGEGPQPRPMLRQPSGDAWNQPHPGSKKRKAIPLHRFPGEMKVIHQCKRTPRDPTTKSTWARPWGGCPPGDPGEPAAPSCS